MLPNENSVGNENPLEHGVESSVTLVPQSPWTRAIGIAHWLLVTLALIGTGLIAAREFAWLHPLFELATHTYWHVMWILTTGNLAAIVIAWWVKYRSSHDVQSQKRIVGSAIWLSMVTGYFIAVTQPWEVLPLYGNRASQESIQVMSWNVWIGNHSDSEIERTIRARNPDVLVLIEVGPWHAQSLGNKLREEYPYSIWVPQTNARGIAMLSKVVGSELRVLNLGNTEMPAIEGTLPSQGNQSSIRILGIHTSSPNLGGRTAIRDHQLRALEKWVDDADTDALIVGDFNITPWSKPYCELLSHARLRDTRSHRGMFSTWPSGLGWLGIPIDHALVTEGIVVHSREVGSPSSNSDHRWIETTVSTPRPR